MSHSPELKLLDECLTFYLNDCLARGQSSRTVDGKSYSVGYFISWCKTQQIVKPREVNKFTLEAYRSYLNVYRQPFNGRPLELATIRNRLTSVKTFLRRLYFFEVLDCDPSERLELPKVPRRLPTGYLNEAQIEKILRQTLLFGEKGIRDRAVMETYYATGLRRMELADLQIGDIDMSSKLLTVNRGKGDKDRRVPIARRACDWVQLYLERVRPNQAGIDSGLALFLANDGLAFREQQLTRLASKYVRRAGIDKRGACNLFRHTTATLMHENGADIRHVQEMLGHADISTTQIYTHVTINKLRETYKRTHPAAKTIGG